MEPILCLFQIILLKRTGRGVLGRRAGTVNDDDYFLGKVRDRITNGSNAGFIALVARNDDGNVLSRTRRSLSVHVRSLVGLIEFVCVGVLCKDLYPTCSVL